MAQNTRDIKRRIASIKNTQQITKAMKMVSAAKLRKAETAIKATRPYSDKLEEVIFNLAWKTKREHIPLLNKRQLKRVGLVVLTSDRGLCGAFNGNILRSAMKYIRENQDKEISLILIGKKAISFFRNKDIPILAEYKDFSNDLHFGHAQKIGNLIMNEFISKKLDGIILSYNEFKNVVQQRVVNKLLLPVEPEEFAEKNKISKNRFMYEPNIDKVLNSLLPQYFHIAIWRVLLESNASEHGARMTAMDAATDNADELIYTLTLYYNRARQASITKEIAEIAGGSEALKNK